MEKFYGIGFWIRLILVLGIGLGCLVVFQKGFLFLGIFFVLVELILVLEFYQFVTKPLGVVHKTLSSVLNEDFSLNAPSKDKSELHRILANLYKKEKAAHFEQQSVKIIYDNLLNSISTGILILRRENEHSDWSIFLMNQSLAKTLQTPVYLSWSNLERNVPEFTKKLEQTGFEQTQQALEISVDNQENQTFSLKTSTIKTYNYYYFIVLIDSVQSIIEKKEKQAWYDLMKVISHEMMNTLTPINTLVDNLQYFGKKENWTGEDKEDFGDSLKTIQKKTIHMLTFVDNYRQLSNFPIPKKTAVNVVDILNDCVEIMKPMLVEKNIQIDIYSEKKDVVLKVDVPLIERAIINLITNSMYAVQENSGDKEIKLKSYINNRRFFVEVKDNGHGIDKKIRDKIFIPFFTTREKGAGIGLSLSRNIMETHNGHLTFKSKPGETVFVMSFY